MSINFLNFIKTRHILFVRNRYLVAPNLIILISDCKPQLIASKNSLSKFIVVRGGFIRTGSQVPNSPKLDMIEVYHTYMTS